jgi:hypothetical protein
LSSAILIDHQGIGAGGSKQKAIAQPAQAILLKSKIEVTFDQVPPTSKVVGVTSASHRLDRWGGRRVRRIPVSER